MIINPYIFGIANTLNDGLISYYKADGDANDYKSYANGTLTGSATASGTPKLGTGSFSLNGSTDFVNCGSDKWNYTSFSISMWVNISSSFSHKTAFANTNYNGSFYGYWFDINATDINFEIGSGAGSTTTLTALGAITLSTYNLITITRSSGTRSRIYVNGTLKVSNSSASDPSYGISVFSRIGDRTLNSGNFEFFNGLIDETAIWNRELTQTEITSLYALGSGQQPPFV